MSVFLTLFVTACGDDGDENPCAGVTCERGVCSAGQCVNSGSCGGDDTACLDGYACSDADTCEARITCTDDTVCGGGLCENGACVNPEKCAVDENCVPGDICVEDVCEPDPCGGCDRGVCDVESATCVDSDICTSANEEEVCLDGSKCIQQVCTTEADFCASLGCDRGECSFEQEACINADNCQGDDAACLDGFYCDANNACAENNCTDGQCTMGVCDRGTGTCINADPCTDAAECTDGFVCVTDTCVEADAACDPACTGNQICEYDAASLSAACIEDTAAGCSSALDCSGDRVCSAEGACEDPVACTPDALEPNDIAAEATVYADTAANGRIDALTVCGGDTDLFTFDTTADVDQVGTLVVDVNIADADVGLGILNVELSNPAGMVVASASNEANGIATGSARLEFAVDALSAGVYTISVADSGDVSTAGVGYSLTADVVDPAVVAACDGLPQFDVNTPALGDTTAATSSALQSSCGDADGSLNDGLHEFVVTERAFYTIRAVPNLDADLALSIRNVCTQNNTELAGGCSDSNGDGGVESISLALDPGTYTVLVSPAAAGAGGGYTLSASSEAIICTDMDNTCIDATDLNDCNANGTAFETVSCTNGCANGICTPTVGDVCLGGVPVDENNPFFGPIDYGQFNNAYDPAGSCAGVPADQTEGPDHVWEVTIPDGFTMGARIIDIGNGFDDMSLYLVSDCAQLGQCLAGSGNTGNATPESISYENTTGATQTLFLIADTDTTVSTYSTIEADIKVFQPVCTPGTTQCVLNRESQTCAFDGSGFDSTTICENGCDATTGECLRASNDTCDTPIALTPGVTVTASQTLATDTETARSGCGSISSGDGNTAELFFTVTTTAVNQTVELLVEPTVSSFDPIIWAADGCTAGVAGACLDGVDDTDTDGADETFEFFAATPGTYLFVVEDGDANTNDGEFDITATVIDPVCTVGQAPSCDPNTAGNIQFCNEQGQFDFYACSSGICDDTSGTAVCGGTLSGSSCFETISLTRAAAGVETTVSGTVGTGSSNIGAETVGFSGQCYWNSTAEYPDADEVIYQIDLLAGETLVASVDNVDPDDTRFYLQTDCDDNDTCYGNKSDIGAHSISYTAPANETVFLVVDYANISTGFFTTDLDHDLTYRIENGLACPPDTILCNASGDLEVCDSDGLIANTFTCTNGCANDACIDTPATMDTCGTALDLGSTAGGAVVGGTFAINAPDYTDTADPSCVPDADGEEAFLSVQAQAGDLIEVTGSSEFDFSDQMVVYVFTDCTDVDGTCIGGDNAQTLEARFQVPTAGTYYIALDRNFANESDIYYYNVQVGPPECTSATPATCNGDAIQYCDRGVFAEYDCATTCTNGLCDAPTGDVCFDPVRLDATQGSGTVNGSWTNKTGTISLPSEGQTGACVMGDFDDGSGLEVFYAIDLTQGDVLEATLDSAEQDALLYVLSDCGDINSCVANDFRVDTDVTRSVAYQAEATGTYFIVVDQDGTATDNYTLDWSVTTGQTCAPNSFVCRDATTVSSCNADGTAETLFTCPNGCGPGGCLVDQAADDCSTAPTITDGFAGIFLPDPFTNAVEIPSGGCAGDETDGNDAQFRVDLDPNQIVRARVRDVYNFDDSQLYIYSDCNDPASSCLSGLTGDAPSSEFTDITVEYQAGATAETVIIGVDSTSSFDDAPRFLEIEKLQPNCTPGQFQNVCTTDGTGFEYCAGGFITEYTCVDTNNDGTTGCTNGRCDEPVGEVCLDPNVLVPDSTTGLASTIGSLSGLDDDYSFLTGNQCTGSITPGGDAVYAVDLVSGETLTANLVSTEATPEDITLYATLECGTLPNSCVDGSDVIGAGDGSAETITYTATADETVYLIVDSFFTTAQGGYSLDISVQ